MGTCEVGLEATYKSLEEQICSMSEQTWELGISGHWGGKLRWGGVGGAISNQDGRTK